MCLLREQVQPTTSVPHAMSKMVEAPPLRRDCSRTRCSQRCRDAHISLPSPAERRNGGSAYDPVLWIRQARDVGSPGLAVHNASMSPSRTAQPTSVRKRMPRLNSCIAPYAGTPDPPRSGRDGSPKPRVAPVLRRNVRLAMPRRMNAKRRGRNNALKEEVTPLFVGRCLATSSPLVARPSGSRRSSHVNPGGAAPSPPMAATSSSEPFWQKCGFLQGQYELRRVRTPIFPSNEHIKPTMLLLALRVGR